MRGAIPPLPEYDPWRGAQKKAQVILYFLLYLRIRAIGQMAKNPCKESHLRESSIASA